MLTKVEVRNSAGTILTLPLEDVITGYPVEDIQGLDPVKATLVYSSFALMDGSQFQAARRENRNIIIKLGIEPDYTYESVSSRRNALYDFFMPKSQVWMRFYEDTGLIVNIEGRVESADSPRFAKDPDMTISIVCGDSNFVDTTAQTISGNTTSGLVETTYEYPGTVETGFLFRLMVNRTLPSFSIYHRPADESLRTLDFIAPLQAGDILEISTVAGAKGASLTRGGTRSDILYAVSPQANWINLFRGPNKLRVYAAGAAIPYTIGFTTKYGAL